MYHNIHYKYYTYTLTEPHHCHSAASGVLTTYTKTETSFSFPELHANKLFNQSLHVVDLNINRYDIIIGHNLIRYLGIDIHSSDMTISWDDAAISWRNIDSTTKDVFELSQYNEPFNSETKRMKHILDDKYSRSDLKSIAKISTHHVPQKINELYTLLNKYEYLFDGNLGTCHGKTYAIKLNQMQNHIMKNHLLFHAYMNSRSNKNLINQGS